MKAGIEIEDAILAGVQSSPGISVRKLARVIGRRTEIVVRATNDLIAKGRLERRDPGNTLYVVYKAFPGADAGLREEFAMVAGESPAQHTSEARETATPATALNPGICPACLTTHMSPALSSECNDRREIRRWLAEIDYPHVAVDRGAGRSIPAGKLSAESWLDRCTLAERVGALRTLRDPVMRSVLTIKVPV